MAEDEGDRGMSDLVNRLRGKYSVGPEGEFGERDFSSFVPAISLEAAKEIERLQTVNNELTARMAMIKNLLDDAFDDDRYDTQGVNQAHRVAFGRMLPRETKTGDDNEHF